MVKHVEFTDEQGKLVPSHELPEALRVATYDQVIVFQGVLAGMYPNKIWEQVCREVPDETRRKVTMRWISRMMVNYQRAARWNKAFAWALDRIKVDAIPIMRPAWRLNELQKQYAEAEKPSERRTILREARGESQLIASLVRRHSEDRREASREPETAMMELEERVDRLLDADKNEKLMATPVGLPGYSEDGNLSNTSGSVGAPDLQVDGAEPQNHPEGHPARSDSADSE